MSIPHAHIDQHDPNLKTSCPGILTQTATNGDHDILECNECGFTTTIRNPTHPQYGVRRTSGSGWEADF